MLTETVPAASGSSRKCPGIDSGKARVMNDSEMMTRLIVDVDKRRSLPSVGVHQRLLVRVGTFSLSTLQTVYILLTYLQNTLCCR